MTSKPLAARVPIDPFLRLRSASLRMRVLRLLSAIILAIFLICAVIAVYFVYSVERNSWHDRQRDAAVAASRTVFDYVGHAEDLLYFLAYSRLGRSGAMLRETVGLHSELLEVIRLDDDGQVVASAYQDQPLLASGSPANTLWFQQAASGSPADTEIQITSSDRPYVILAVSALDGGVAAARLRMDILWETIANIRFGETGRAYVVSETGDIIAHNDPAVMFDQVDLTGRPELDAFMEADGYEWSGEYVNFEGAAVVGVTVPIGTTGWVLVTEMSRDEAYASSRSALVLLGGSLMAFMVLLIGAARGFLLRAILLPIEKLQEGAERIGQGDLNHHIAIDRYDEIGQVASAFNDMAASLRQRQQQLATQAASLSSEIAERALAERELRNSEARYRAIVEDQTELICRFRVDGILTFVNDAYCRYFRMSREDLVGSNLIQLIPEPERALVEAQYTTLSAEKPTATYQHCVLAESGMRWTEWTDRAIFGPAGSVLEIQSVGRDITQQRLADEEIKRLYVDLENRVIERTEQLALANEELQNEIAERRRVEQTLRDSEARLKLALGAAHAGVWEWDMLENRVYWSEEIYAVMGMEPGATPPRYETWLRHIHPDDRDHINRTVLKAVERQSDLDIEFRVVWPDGSIHWNNEIGQFSRDAAGRPLGMYGIQMDITERKLSTERIRASLQEKETLLKEIHHRVKNNLQIVSSLLHLQSHAISDAATRAMFADSQNRIRSMALVHERLYRSADLARIDFDTYLRDLVGSLIKSYRRQAQNVEFRVDVAEIMLDIDTAIPCGLIVSELVSNALKHAFPDGRAGFIQVELRQETGQVGEADGDRKFCLVVADDGVGMQDPFVDRRSLPLGLQLVDTLIRQLGGSMDVRVSGGTRFEVRF